MDFYLSVAYGNVDKIYKTAHACYVNSMVYKGESPFLKAFHLGQMEVIHHLWEMGGDVHLPNAAGETPLHLASKYGHLDVVDFLLTKKASINETTPDRHTALHYAVAHKRTNICLFLISKGADTSIKNYLGRTPLMTAIYQDNSFLAMELIEKGSCIRGSKDESPLTMSILYRLYDVTMSLLICGKRERHSVYYLAILYLIRSSSDETLVILEHLLDMGINPNRRAKKNHTALIEACKEQSIPCIRLLLSYGANPNGRGCNNDTPLLWAVRKNNFDIVQLLIKAGANPNYMNHMKISPMTSVCFNGQHDIFEYLLYRCDLSKRTSKGNRTYLIHASVSPHYRIVEKLLLMGPKHVVERDRYGHTAHVLAKFHNSLDIAELLNVAEMARKTKVIDTIETSHLPIWRRYLPTEGKRSLDYALQSFRIDSLACYHALFLHEDTLLRWYRMGYSVDFSNARIRQLTRAMGSRPIRNRIVRYLIFSPSMRNTFREILRQR